MQKIVRECRWAAIASYLPQRTDNDIKNYWNTNLKKRVKKAQGENQGDPVSAGNNSQPISIKGQWERRLQTDIHMAKQALCEALSLDKPTNSFHDQNSPITNTNTNTNTNTTTTTTTNNYFFPCTRPYQSSFSTTTATYASSTENIARLLPNWMKNSPKLSQTSSETTATTTTTQNSFNNSPSEGAWSVTPLPPSFNNSPSEGELSVTPPPPPPPPEELNSVFRFSYSDQQSVSNNFDAETAGLVFQDESKPNNLDNQVPLSLIEKWLLDDSASVGQGQGDLMNLSLGETDPRMF